MYLLAAKDVTVAIYQITGGTSVKKHFIGKMQMLDRILRLLIGPVIAFLACTAANATDYQQILNELNEA